MKPFSIDSLVQAVQQLPATGDGQIRGLAG
jgi:hypothetical protein